MRRILTFSILLLAYAATLCAQQFTASGPSVVGVDSQFKVQFTVDTQTDVGDLTLGTLPDGLEMVWGPSRSTSSSISVINGKTTESSSTKFTCVLKATKKGTYTLPAARLTVGGKALTSNTLPLTVGQTAPQGSTTSSQTATADTKISSSDLFIKVSANKQRVKLQEPVVVTYKVYTLVNLTQLQGKMPDLGDCLIEEIDLPKQKQFVTETLNGKTYKTVTWSQYVLFPQRAGTLKVPSVAFEGIVAQYKPKDDPLEAFMNGGTAYVETKKKIVAPSVDIVVEPLPNQPKGFSGGVGTFSLEASLNRQNAIVGDTVLLHVVVSGLGNLNLIDRPQVAIPQDMGLHEVEESENLTLTTGGMKGQMVFDHILVPTRSGIFKIPATEFVYFDPSARVYKTAKTQSFTLTVANPDGTVAPAPAPIPAPEPKSVDWGFLSFLLLVAILLLGVGYVVGSRLRKK